MITRAWIDKEDGTRKVEMLASGTKIDAYDDRFSPDAVRAMASDFIGKDFLPDHRAEWDEILGTIVDGRVDDQVQYFATAQLDPMGAEAEQKVDALFSMVQAGKRVGVSIAGWIKRVMFEEDEETGKEIRVIDSLDPDHIAVTRRPAYEDAMITGLVRSMNEKDNAALINKILADAPVEDEATSEPEHTRDTDVTDPPPTDNVTFTGTVSSTLRELVREVLAEVTVEGEVEGDGTGEVLPEFDPDVEREAGPADAADELRELIRRVFGKRDGVETDLRDDYQELVAARGALRTAPEFTDIEPTLIKWLAHVEQADITEDELECAADLMLAGDLPDCLKTEENDMTPEQLEALLTRINQQNSETIAASVAAAVQPITEGMAAILQKQEEIDQKADGAVEAAQAAQQRADSVADEPDRQGASTARTMPDGSPIPEDLIDPFAQVARDAKSPEFDEACRKDPHGMLRNVLTALSDSSGFCYLADRLREEGKTSPLGNLAEGVTAWAPNSHIPPAA